MKQTSTIMICALCIGICIVGCGSYYMVKDPTTDKVFYTTGIEEKETGVTFIDAKTGAKVTLQNSEIKEIEKDTYNAALLPPQATQK